MRSPVEQTLNARWYKHSDGCHIVTVLNDYSSESCLKVSLLHFFNRRSVHSEIYIVHLPTNAIFIKLGKV